MSPIKPVDPRAPHWKEVAEFLRDLADRFERGDVTEAMIVYNDRAKQCYGSWGHFDDRWRALDALEHAKANVMERP